MRAFFQHGLVAAFALIVLLFAASGCHVGFRSQPTAPFPRVDAPRELAKVSLPEYTIEPPDVLLIEAIQLVPRGPHQIEPFDVLNVQVTPTFPDHPIDGPYQIDPTGVINFGAPYGSVTVAGLSVDQVKQAIEAHLRKTLNQPAVTVSLAQSVAGQQITGEHLVGPDGMVILGSFGRVFVTGLTIDQAKSKIETHLRRSFLTATLSVDIAGYNSKVYYVITEGAGFGDGVARFPITGNETVLDAVSHINGMSQVSSKQVWIARPAPDYVGCDQILPVDWIGITKGGSTQTNYQIMPGDRIFIAENHLVATDTALGKFLAPFERILGVTLLGGQAVNSVTGRVGTGL